MKKSVKRIFRLNVVIVFERGTNPVNFREPVHSLLRSLSWIYNFEYAISVDHRKLSDSGSDDQPSTDKVEYDLFYFRSTESTLISSREFRKLISFVFAEAHLHTFGVDIFYQLQSALKDYPFPNEYFLQLNYPLVDHYKDGHKTRCIFEAALDCVSEQLVGDVSS